MNYIEYDFMVSPTEMGAEILMAELAEVGYDSFEDTPTGIKAYIPKENKNTSELRQVLITVEEVMNER